MDSAVGGEQGWRRWVDGVGMGGNEWDVWGGVLWVISEELGCVKHWWVESSWGESVMGGEQGWSC